MNVRHPIYSAFALFTCLLLAIPAGVVAQAPQPAGKITIVLPIVNVIRGPQQISASTSQQVFWGDVINTGHLARARVALTDGSILSVGSDSNMTIAKHDATEQQTDLELNYGRVRANAVKLSKPKASFQIRTPTGVAGVVGTDFAVESDNDSTRVVVYEGKVRFCALVSEEKRKQGEEAGAEGGLQEGQPLPEDQDQQNGRKRRVFIGPCVVVAAGAASAVRFNQAPSQPVPATPMTATQMANATSSTGGGAGAGGAAGGAAGGGAGVGAGTIAGVSAGVAAGVATAVVRGVATTKTCSTPPPTTGGGAVPRANCVNKAGNKLPGQRP